MTAILPFLPSNLAVPSFTAVLDGEDHRVSVTWNISAKRYYINVYTHADEWIVTVPLVSTPPARRLESLVYNPLRGVMTAKLVPPTQWPVPLSPAGLHTFPGTVIDYTLENFAPAILNQTFRSLHIDSQTFSFEFAPNPGDITNMGTVTRMMNMVAGVFEISTLIYRNGSFEVTP